MAEVEKFTDEGVMMFLKHAERQKKIDSNNNIVTLLVILTILTLKSLYEYLEFVSIKRS